MIFLTVTKSRHIVEKGINPYIDHVFWIRWNWDSPSKGSPRYCQIFQAWLDEVFQHFIETTIWRDEIWLGFEKFHQTVLVFTEAKEIRFFRNPFYFVAWWGYPTDDLAILITVNLSQLAFCKELFIRYWIPTRVLTQVDVVLRKQTFKDLSHHFFMVVVCRTDEFIIWDIE